MPDPKIFKSDFQKQIPVLNRGCYCSAYASIVAVTAAVSNSNRDNLSSNNYIFFDKLGWR
jgi:hypothetical protein